MSKCYQCGSKMVPGGAEMAVRVGDLLFKGVVPGVVCPACGESYVDHEVALAYERDVAQRLALEGPATGPAFRLIRKVLRLSSSEVSDLLGVQPATVSRWEHGKQPINPHVVLLLGSMLLDQIEGRHTTEERVRRQIAA